MHEATANKQNIYKYKLDVNDIVVLCSVNMISLPFHWCLWSGVTPYPGIKVDNTFYTMIERGFQMERPYYASESV